MNNPYERAIVTEYGKYKLKVTKDVETFYSLKAITKEIGVVINLGGKDTNCIQNKVLHSVFSNTENCMQIKVPYEGSLGNILWIQSGKENECSIDDKEQSGEKLIHMVHLGITIAKEINSNLKTLELKDSASFKCKLPNGRLIAMNSTEHDIAFYQQSYYEKRYKAELLNNTLQKNYKENIKNFDDPSKKPLEFNFENNDIEKELLPLYNSSTTWKEFFHKINDKYGKKKCTVVEVWIKSALLHILNDNIYSGQNWKIDVKDIPIIRYEERVLLKSGGRRTRKMEKYIEEPTIPEILEMDWKTFFKQFK